MSDDRMLSPANHEGSALDRAMKGDTTTAQVYAILALASAVNRLAAAQEVIANETIARS
jgi:hypothetical protein